MLIYWRVTMVHFHKQIQCFFSLRRHPICYSLWAKLSDPNTSWTTGKEYQWGYWLKRANCYCTFFCDLKNVCFDPNVLVRSKRPRWLAWCFIMISWFSWCLNHQSDCRIFPARLCLKYSQPKSIHGLSKTCGPIKTAVLEYPVSLDKPIGNSGNMWQHHVNTHTHM